MFSLLKEFFVRHTSSTLQVTHHIDGGHGWFEVKRNVAQKIMGNYFNNISDFSYSNDDLIYLEEDEDAGLLIRLCKQQSIKLVVTARDAREFSIIRTYEQFIG
ncbi:MAG: hypothetical protein R8L53_05660 [Mariprofundales bacterium]